MTATSPGDDARGRASGGRSPPGGPLGGAGAGNAREAPTRRGEPVTVGLPWPRGAAADDRQFRLVGPDGSPQVLQTRVLDRWPDGSVRWCLFDFFAAVDGRGGYRIEVGEDPVRPV